jgi:hypothetical protein
MARKFVMLQLLLLLGLAGVASAGNVSPERARIVAGNWLTSIVQSYGSWGGDASPAIAGQEPFYFKGVIVGYNFTVAPRGHILVSGRDDIPAVKLYSDTSTLSLQNETMQEKIEWITREIFEVGEAIETHRTELATMDSSQNPDILLWAKLEKDPQDFQNTSGITAAEAASFGPLLTTTWDQDSPYNQQCPLMYGGYVTVPTGCVATAAAQIMRYWNYPTTGLGSTSYSWDSGSTYVTLSRNFAASTYDWANMPSSINYLSTTAQINAVAKLMADVGIAFHMDYDYWASGAYTPDAPYVFTNYFKYATTATWVNRSSYASASAWMNVFRAETQAGRPSQLRIKDPSEGGHSVVVDGYRDSPAENVHINMGWSGSYDGWYTPDSFTTDRFHWTNTSYQGAAIGIQPATGPRELAASFSGSGLYETFGTLWMRLSPITPENFVYAGSTLYADFGTSGVYSWNGTSWTQRAAANPKNMIVSGATLYGDFGTWGIYSWNGTSWTQLSTFSPENMLASGSTLYGDFGTSGVYSWNGTSWTQLTASNPENLVISNSSLFGDFGASGIWRWVSGTTWTQVATTNPENMIDCGSVLFGDFGASGIWRWVSGTTWTQVGTANPENMVVGNSTLYGDFGALGIWRWVSGTTWTQVGTANPENMVAAGVALYGDFGATGLYKWKDSVWTLLTTVNPLKMAKTE